MSSTDPPVTPPPAQTAHVLDAPVPPQPAPSAPAVVYGPSAPAGTTLATIGRRIGAVAVDFGFGAGVWLAAFAFAAVIDVLFAVPFLAYLAYSVKTAMNAQTPGKAALGLQAVDKDSGQPLTFGRYVFVRGLLGGIILGIPLVGFVLWFMPLWDQLNQSVGGKVSNSVVIDLR